MMKGHVSQKSVAASITVVVFLILVIVMMFVLPKRLNRHPTENTATQVTEVTPEPTVAVNSVEPDETELSYQQALLLLNKADAGDASALAEIGLSEAEIPPDATAAMLLYRAALEQFQNLGGYQDSEACAARCRDGIAAQEQALRQRAFDQAAALLEDRHYSEACRHFRALGEYGDSGEMVKEAIYRKAVALCDVIRNYDVRGIYAGISMDPDQKSSFVLSGANAPAADSPCVTALLAACGNDPVELVPADGSEQSMPLLADSVRGLFESLEGYRDSADCIAAIESATDYTREFYRLVEEGKLQEAQNWLDAWNGELDGRDYWQNKLAVYAPYCGSWSLHSGDKTVVSLGAGRSANCYEFTTRVTFDDEYPILHLTARDGEEEYGLDFYRESDDGLFYNDDNTKYHYVLVINNMGRMSYMMYKSEGGLVTSAEYKRD